MHEVSLMDSVLSTVLESAKENGITKISKIKLMIGNERMVMGDSLQFAFELLKEGSAAHDADLEWDETQGQDFYIDYYEGE